MPFTTKKIAIPDVVLIETRIFTDERGVFFEVFKESAFSECGIPYALRQINTSVSKKNVVRGLHFQQEPHAQAKVVQVVDGEVFDVAVDIRKGSATFGKWVGEILSAENKNMLYIPKGFAHGFSVLSESAQVIYFCDAEYKKEAERAIRWNDPDIGIDWPIDTHEAIVSAKDKNAPMLKDVIV